MLYIAVEYLYIVLLDIRFKKLKRVQRETLFGIYDALQKTPIMALNAIVLIAHIDIHSHRVLCYERRCNTLGK